MGSDSDASIMREAIKALKQFGIPFEAKIVSAHRTPEFMQDYAKAAHDRGIEVIIAGAGGAAHLPGMVASYTPLPVIGVPIAKGKLNGLDALLSIAQMPKGIPVATVAIDGAGNAGLLAARILSVGHPKIREQLLKHRRGLQKHVKTRQPRLKTLLR
jgi:5-(carboxyamino)imidazole ribonucleotide mutase